MAATNPYAKYASNNINSASKEELTLMLYEGALKFTNQAIIAIEGNDFNKANDLILRVEDIIREFQVTLDHNYEISQNLDALYDYMYRLLVDANVSKELEPLNEVKEYLRQFRDSWKEAMKLAKNA
jgi:flagellar protein FliS